MPTAVFKAVREVSSEDSVHRADNLLKGQHWKKWKTRTVGETSAHIILELEEPSEITGIDIGNEHSAFVEVLVGRTGDIPENFTDILLACSFMTPAESKTSSIPNRVRCFNKEALVENTIGKKWQLVKIICTQPFNKHVQYGLSFIKMYVANVALVKKNTLTKPLVPEKCLSGKLVCASSTSKSPFQFGKFALREESPPSDLERSPGLFKRWNISRTSGNTEETPTMAASIRQASAGLRQISESSAHSKVSPKMPNVKEVPLKQQSDDEKALPIRDRNRMEIAFGDEDEINSSVKQKLLEKQIEIDKERFRQKNVEVNKKKRRSTDNSPATRVIHNQSTSEKDNSLSSRPTKKIKSATAVQYRPFNQLLRDVVLVISGIQNPDRADLRNKALAMGAKYHTDWDSGCTHLICAFKNTPKYKQVKGKGKIISRSWVEKCFSLKKYLPWRRYALDSADLGQPESDTEIYDESLNQAIETSDAENEQPFGLLTEPTANVEPDEDRNNTLSMYDLGDQDLNYTQDHSQVHNVSSGSDTDDEIQRAVEQKKILHNNNTNQKNSTEKGIYEVTTEEEDYLKDKLELEDKPEEFFKELKLYICSKIGAMERLKLESIIKKYGGKLTYCLSEAQYAIAEQQLNKCDAMTFTGETIYPLWIYECNDMEKKVPTMPYLVKI